MKNLYLENGDKYKCNGCGICTLVCPKKCIHMEQDKEGFFYPVIDEKLCIKCGRCKNICSNCKKNNNYKQKAFIAINKNEDEREKSASGGMFIILARYVIEKNGIVFGAEYDSELNVRHGEADTLKKCKNFMGSKYVRSDMTGIYNKVENYLKQDKYVLFTGTPCQCNALKIYLNKEYDKLILCDIICHGNPSPKVFKKYKEELEKKKKIKVKDIKFRSKENGWNNSTPIIEYDNGEKVEDPIFYQAFISELISRPSCYRCPFVSQDRISDFTIGDMWGIEKISPHMNDNKGVSLFLVNSDKAVEILSEIEKNIKLEEVDIKLAFSYNHNKNVRPNLKRDKFFGKVDNSKSIIRLMKKYSKGPLPIRLRNKIIKNRSKK